MADLVTTLLELRDLGVGFASLMEALDLTTPSGRALAGLLAVFAEFEREILRERVRAGLAHARENGKRLGRPPAAALNTKQVRQLFRAGVSKAAIARRLRIGRTSVRRILASEKVADSNVTQLSRKHTTFLIVSVMLPIVSVTLPIVSETDTIDSVTEAIITVVDTIASTTG